MVSPQSCSVGRAYHVSTSTPRSQLSRQLDGEGDLERNRLMKNKQMPTYLRLDDGVMRVRDEVQVDTIAGQLSGSRSRRHWKEEIKRSWNA